MEQHGGSAPTTPSERQPLGLYEHDPDRYDAGWDDAAEPPGNGAEARVLSPA